MGGLQAQLKGRMNRMRVENTIVVDRPLEEVFTSIADYESHTNWQNGLRDAKFTSQGLTGVGTTFAFVNEFLGRRLEGEGEITEYEPDAKFAWRSKMGPLLVDGSWTFEPVAHGTRVIRMVESEAGGLMRLALPIMGFMLRRQGDQDLAKLKAQLEAQAAGGG
jgi:uncharacterized membrane protein